MPRPTANRGNDRALAKRSSHVDVVKRAQPGGRRTTPLCPTTPGGIPVRLLVDAAPRSRARRAVPLFLFLVLALGVAAVALAR
jgi:hypothetical protein